jgi:hypothetical protein
MIEDGRRKMEDGGWKIEAESRKTDAGSPKTEDHSLSRKLEVALKNNYITIM